MRTSLGAVAIAALVVGCGGGESSIAALSPSGQPTLTPGALSSIWRVERPEASMPV